MTKQYVEVLWWPKGWAPTLRSTHTSVWAAEQAAREEAKRWTIPGTIFIRIHYGPDAGERTMYRLVDRPEVTA